MKLTEKKRESIVEAAIEEFREQGFLGAKITRIAQRAEVSTRTLYKHFASKEALFEAISEVMIARSAAMAPVAYDPDRALEAQLVETLNRYLAVITEPTTIGLNRMVIAELLRDLPRSRAFFAALETHDYPITALIGEAMTAGRLRTQDPAYAANQLIGLVKSQFFWPAFMLGEDAAAAEPNEAVMRDCVQMFLAHYDRQR